MCKVQISPGPFLHRLLSFAEYVSTIYLTHEFKNCLYELAGFLSSGGNLRNEFVIFEIDKMSVDESVVNVLELFPRHLSLVPSYFIVGVYF